TPLPAGRADPCLPQCGAVAAQPSGRGPRSAGRASPSTQKPATGLYTERGSYALLAQLVEHFHGKGLQPAGRTRRRMAQQSRFAAVSCVAARTIRLSYAIGFGPVWAPLAVSA